MDPDHAPQGAAHCADPRPDALIYPGSDGDLLRATREILEGWWGPVCLPQYQHGPLYRGMVMPTLFPGCLVVFGTMGSYGTPGASARFVPWSEVGAVFLESERPEVVARLSVVSTWERYGDLSRRRSGYLRWGQVMPAWCPGPGGDPRTAVRDGWLGRVEDSGTTTTIGTYSSEAEARAAVDAYLREAE